MLTQLGCEPRERWDTQHRPPTTGPQWVRSTESKDAKHAFGPHQETTKEKDQPAMRGSPKEGRTQLSATIAKATGTLLESAFLMDCTDSGVTAYLSE